MFVKSNLTQDLHAFFIYFPAFLSSAVLNLNHSDQGLFSLLPVENLENSLS